MESIENNPELKEQLIQKIGNGEKDVLIEITDYFNELDDFERLSYTKIFNLGAFQIDGIEVVRKVAVIYLSDDKKTFNDRCNNINRIINTKYISYINYFFQHTFKLKINGIEKELFIVTYVEP